MQDFRGLSREFQEEGRVVQRHFRGFSESLRYFIGGPRVLGDFRRHFRLFQRIFNGCLRHYRTVLDGFGGYDRGQDRGFERVMALQNVSEKFWEV